MVHRHFFVLVSLFIVIFPPFLSSKINPISTIPSSVPHDTKKAELGKDMFFDPILSIDNTISCAHCHQLNLGGTDGLAVSIGIEGREGNINAPTLFNSVFNFRQFWNGRAKDLAEQAAGPIQNPVEMGHDFEALLQNLNNSDYKSRFYEIYKEPLHKDQILEVLAEYEKLLITPDGDFDRFLGGDNSAISDQAKRGYELFQSKGCIVCHHGVNVGGNFYSKIGIFKEFQATTLGRYEVTQNEFDKHMVKVPTLRNIEKTAPYFHHGETKNLKDAITIMAEYQLGINLTSSQIDDIIAFLHTLGGKLPDAALP